MKVKDLLIETTVEDAKEIRTKLKKRFGLTRNDVSVKKDRNAIRVTVKSLKGLAYYHQIEKIAMEKEDYREDAITGEILSGGNQFVFVEIDNDLSDKITKKIEKKKDENGDIEIMNMYIIKKHENKYQLFPINGGGSYSTKYNLEHVVKDLIKLVAKRKSTWEKFLKFIKEI
jgi:hypothetical protein